jgi:hypothetical protein
MNKNPLKEKSYLLAIEIVKLCKRLASENKEPFPRLRSGTGRRPSGTGRLPSGIGCRSDARSLRVVEETD